MASRKNLKKNVNYIIGELFTECLINAQAMPEADRPKADTLLTKILGLQNDFVTRISHTGKGSEKLFYKKFKQEFNKEVSNIIDEIAKLA